MPCHLNTLIVMLNSYPARISDVRQQWDGTASPSLLSDTAAEIKGLQWEVSFSANLQDLQCSPSALILRERQLRRLKSLFDDFLMIL